MCKGVKNKLEKIGLFSMTNDINSMDMFNKYSLLSSNPSIFNKRINYKYLYQRMNIIREELIMKCLHPSRLERWIEMSGDIDDF